MYTTSSVEKTVFEGKSPADSVCLPAVLQLRV